VCITPASLGTGSRLFRNPLQAQKQTHSTQTTSIEAFTYPEEFNQFDGLSTPSSGTYVGQQARGSFGLSYRSRVGNDLVGDDYGYKLHLIYGCTASPSEKAYNTINDSPEAITFSWEISTIPMAVTDMRPTSVITIDTVTATPANVTALEELLYGKDAIEPALPTPDEVVALMST
jgi:hypothetical protein